MDIIGIIISLLLIASFIFTLYKKNYNSAVGIGIMFVVYILLKYKGVFG